MILSDKQMHVSRAALTKLESALDAIRSQSDSPGWVRQIEIDALERQIKEIRTDMKRYENLCAGRVVQSHPIPHTPSASRMACSSTSQPAAVCSGVASSISLWLMPSLQGMKIIAAGHTLATYLAS